MRTDDAPSIAVDVRVEQDDSASHASGDRPEQPPINRVNCWYGTGFPVILGRLNPTEYPAIVGELGDAVGQIRANS